MRRLAISLLAVALAVLAPTGAAPAAKRSRASA